jgi:hypothetical protein
MAREIHRNPLYKWRFKAVNIIYQWNQWWIFHQAMFMIRGGIQISRLLLDSQPAGNSISNGKSRKEPHKCAKPLCMYIYIYIIIYNIYIQHGLWSSIPSWYNDNPSITGNLIKSQ